jgi:putative inorganic carbon (hco3(-)) transporter
LSKYTLSKNSIIYTIIIVYFLFMNLQRLSIFGLSADDTPEIKIYQILTLLIFISYLILNYNNIELPPFLILLLFSIIVVLSLINYARFDFNLIIINYCIAFFSFYNGLFLGKYLSYNKLISAIRYVSTIIIFIVVIKLVFYKEAIVTFISNPWLGHPILPVIYGGGVNLEATWIALSIIFYMGTKAFYPILIVSFIISSLYASRGGAIISIVCLIYYIYLFSSTNRKFNLIILTVIIISSMFLIVRFGPDNYLIERMALIGEDPGSLSRIEMWGHCFKEYINSPVIGYGAGNAVPIINKSINVGKILEDNLHNYYLQLLLDFGIIGFIPYMLIIYCVFIIEKSLKFKNHFGAYILVFSIIANIQFRGAECIYWFIFGIYISIMRKPFFSQITKYNSFKLLISKWSPI